MEGYICLMVLMALVFGVPLIILSNRVSTLDFRIRSLEGRMTDPSPAPQTAEAPERAKRDDMPPVINKPTPPLPAGAQATRSSDRPHVGRGSSSRGLGACLL